MTLIEARKYANAALDGLSFERQQIYICQWLADATVCRESRRVTHKTNWCECFVCQYDRIDSPEGES